MSVHRTLVNLERGLVAMIYFNEQQRILRSRASLRAWCRKLRAACGIFVKEQSGRRDGLIFEDEIDINKFNC